MEEDDNIAVPEEPIEVNQQTIAELSRELDFVRRRYERVKRKFNIAACARCRKDRGESEINTCACGIVYCIKCFEWRSGGQNKMMVICSKCNRQVCGYCSADLCVVCDKYVCKDTSREPQCVAFMCGMDCGSVICCVKEAGCDNCQKLLCPTCMFNGRLHACKPLVANCGHRVYTVNTINTVNTMNTINTLTVPSNIQVSPIHPIQWCTQCPQVRTYCIENCSRGLLIHSGKHTIRYLLLVFTRINLQMPPEVIHMIFEFLVGGKVLQSELPCLDENNQ